MDFSLQFNKFHLLRKGLFCYCRVIKMLSMVSCYAALVLIKMRFVATLSIPVYIYKSQVNFASRLPLTAESRYYLPLISSGGLIRYLCFN